MKLNLDKPYSEMSNEERAAYRSILETEVERGNSLRKLIENKEFKEFFLDFYLEEEPKRLVLLMGDSNCSKNELMRIDINERMIGIARFNAFMLEQESMSNNSALKLFEIDNPTAYDSEPTLVQ